MARYTKTGTPSTIGELNAQLDLIAVAINDTFSRVGDSPNQLESTLDVNSNRIINLPTPASAQEPLRLEDLPLLSTALTNATTVDSIDLMKATPFVAGNYVICKRYSPSGAFIKNLVYTIQTTQTVDGYLDHTLSNGNVAILITDNTILAEQAGVINGIDATLALQAVVNKAVALGIRDIDARNFSFQLSTINISNVDIDFTGTVIEPLNDENYVIRCTVDCNYVGVKGAEYRTNSTGIKGYRFIQIASADIKEINIRDNKSNSGRIIVEVTNTATENKYYVNRNKWTSTLATHSNLNYLQVQVNNTIVNEGSQEAQGMFVEGNVLDVYALTTANQDIVKLTADMTGVRFKDNNLSNSNPASLAELDTYTGASSSFISGNIFRDVSIKSQAAENSGVNDNSTMVSIINNKFTMSTTHDAGWAILRKGTSFVIAGNTITKKWPSNIPTAGFRAIWLQSPAVALPDGTLNTVHFSVSNNVIDVAYASNAGAFDVQPIAYTLGSGANPIFGSISGNSMRGGRSLYYPNDALSFTGIVAEGNSWLPNSDATIPALPNSTGLVKTAITNGYVLRSGNGYMEAVMHVTGTTNVSGYFTVSPDIVFNTVEFISCIDNSGFSGGTVPDFTYAVRSAGGVMPSSSGTNININIFKGGVAESSQPFNQAVRIQGSWK